MAWALLEIVVPLILAVLLGILIGWFLWRWRRTKVTHTEWASMQMRANSGERAATEIQGLTTDLEGRDADLAACRARVAELEAELEAANAGGGAGAGADDAAATDETAADAGDGGHEIQGLTGAAAVADAAADDADSADAGEDAAESAGAGDEAAAAAADDAAGDEGAAENAVIGGERHPYGEGSHAPFAADAKVMPDGYDIKGNVDSMLYHRPDSRVYGATIAEVWFDTPERAEAAGFTLAGSHPKDSNGDDSADDGAAAERAVVGGERHPYGEGSHAPFDGAEGDMPEGYPIKGNADSMLYHREDSRSYKATIPEVWFDTPERAEAAGFGLANSHPKD